jgi:hypothetical protein
MVPALLYLLVRKYVIKNWPAIRRKMSEVTLPKNFLLVIGFLALMLLKLVSLRAQEKQLQYNIIRNGKVIGWTKLVRTTIDHQVDIKLQSEVKTRFVFQFVVKAMEEAVFNNGSLVYTSQFRKLNSDVKENKQMKWTSRGYEVQKGNKIQTLSFTAMTRHMLGLYFTEPSQGEKVYSDSFQQMLNVERIAEGAYKIRLPDGNSCSYYYKNGICTNVKIDHRLYSAELMLAQAIN